MRRPFPLGPRGGVVLAIALLAAFAWSRLDLSLDTLLPSEGGLRIASDFVTAALEPALGYESGRAPTGAPPFLLRVLDAARRTVLFAAAAMSLALPVGLVLGFLGSTRRWSGAAEGAGRRPLAGPLVQGVARLVAACMRSVHELLWAIVLLAAFGINTAAAVVALAIPFAGVLAKVFSELLDEAPDDAARALRAAGASPVQVFLVGTAARAFPDMAAYAFYRFECGVRSSAILGFFGYETLGYYLKLSFESLYYREVWTYLYALLAIVLALEAWSAALRRRFVA